MDVSKYKIKPEQDPVLVLADKIDVLLLVIE